MRIPIFLTAFSLLSLFAAPVAAFALSDVGGNCLDNTDCSSGVCSSNNICLSGSTQTTGANTSQIQTTGVNTGQSVTLINPLGSGTSLESFLTSILSFVIRIGTIAVMLMLVFVGYKFVVAQGSDTKLVEARKMLLWTVIGALILLGAQAIASAIQATVRALGG